MKDEKEYYLPVSLLLLHYIVILMILYKLVIQSAF